MFFDKRQRQKYRDGYVSAIKDIDESELAECYVTLLKSLDVKATLVAPILQGRILFGLLIAHQCEKPRNWKKWEVNLFKQLAIQVGTALDLAYQYEQAVRSRLDVESLLEQKIQTKNNHAYLYSLDLSSRIKTLIQQIIDTNIQTSELNETTVNIAINSSKTLESVYKNIEYLSSAIKTIRKMKALNQGKEEILELMSSLNKNAMQISALALNLRLNKSGENANNFTMVAQEISKISAEFSQNSQALQQSFESFKVEISEIGDIEKTVLRLLEDAEAIRGVIINLTKIISTSSKTHENLQSEKGGLSSVNLLSEEVIQEFQVEPQSCFRGEVGQYGRISRRGKIQPRLPFSQG